MNTQEALKILRQESIFYTQWCHLQKAYAPVGYIIPEGEEFKKQLAITAQYCKEMYEAGVRIHSFDISTGWTNLRDFDPSECDMVLDTFFSVCPDAYLIPRITNFNTGADWEKEYPNDVYLFEAAKDASADEIRDMVGSEHQPPLGDEMPGVFIGHQSFASKRWKQDSLFILEKLIDHLENSPYKDKIIGYHVGYGKCGETHFWGRGPDYSRANKEAFYEYGMNKYKTVEALEKAWKTTGITPENVPLPGEAIAFPKTGSVSVFFHEDDFLFRDYNEYIQKLSYSNIHDFCSLIKKMTGKMVGVFHGYLMFAGANHHGHTDFQLLLEDENVDFFAAPKSYYRSGLGQPGGSYCIPQSINRKKLWIDELDNRTHLVPDAPVWGTAKNAEEFRHVMRREFARNEMTGSSYWWMDLGGGWYHDPALHEEAGQLQKIHNQFSQHKRESIADVLLVGDELCSFFTTQDISFYHRTMQDTQMETAVSGAIADFYRFNDLPELDLKKYKLVIFMNSFRMTKELMDTLGFSPDAHFLWNYLPGGSFAEAEKLTQMKMRETGCYDTFPYLEILPEDGLTVLETYETKPLDIDVSQNPFMPPYTVDGKEINPNTLYRLPEHGIRTAAKKNHIICAAPSADRYMIRRLAEEAGCRLYAPAGNAVYGNSLFLSVHNAEGETFKFTF